MESKLRRPEKKMNKQINKLINHSTDKSSHRKFSIKEDVFENPEKLTEKHPCQRIFFNKVPGLRPVTLY